jgi:putative endonuclease
VAPQQAKSLAICGAFLVLTMVVYVLHSKKLDKYYIGETADLNQRLKRHNNGHLKNAFTAKTNDWHVVISIECSHRASARLIEQHIKQMKSRIYIENLIRYPEMIEKLLAKYDNPGSSR